MFKKLLPRENRFFDLFNQHADTVLEGISLFRTMLETDPGKQSLAGQLKALENRADDIAHDVFGLLNTVFVTPFDREDIRSLVNHMDDIIDLVEKAGARLDIFHIFPPPETIIQQAGLLNRAFVKLASAIASLSDLKQKEQMLAICVDVNSLENEGDTLLRKELKTLFSTRHPADPVDLIKKKELVELLESAIDRCEDLSNVIETILIKYA